MTLDGLTAYMCVGDAAGLRLAVSIVVAPYVCAHCKKDGSPERQGNYFGRPYERSRRESFSYRFSECTHCTIALISDRYTV